MIGMWLFAVFWCTVSFAVLSQTLKASTPWGWLLFAVGMTLPGVVILLWLIATHYQRWRVGRITLVASPDVVTCGEKLHLRLELARTDLGPRDVRFKLELQESDEGWRTVQTLEHLGQLHPGVPWVNGAITLPADAKPSQRGWRWRVVAVLEGFRLATAECIVTVKRAPVVAQASPAAVTLDIAPAASVPNGAAADARAPAGAQETAPGTWCWSQTYGLLKVVGGVLLLLSGFWLWHTLRGTWPELLALRHDASLRVVGALLFQVPFWAAGMAVAMVGLGLLSAQFRATAQVGSVTVTVHALGRTWITMPVNASDIELLQPAPSLVNNGKVLSYALAARTATGVVTLPMKSDSAAELLPQARWLAAVLGRDGLRFDPVVMSADEPRFAMFDRVQPLDQWQQLSGLGRTLKRLMTVCMGLGILGFVLQFLGAGLLR
ncbi:MAG: hypothetical protein FD135_4391 [Comamonadaceae bacterium]|nr:MAG: hypothetical protein FD135_4391 [Comamonadaceae bacterium]